MSVSVKWPGDICGCDEFKVPQYACVECWKKLADELTALRAVRDAADALESGSSGEDFRALQVALSKVRR